MLACNSGFFCPLWLNSYATRPTDCSGVAKPFIMCTQGLSWECLLTAWFHWDPADNSLVSERSVYCFKGVSNRVISYLTGIKRNHSIMWAAVKLPVLLGSSWSCPSLVIHPGRAVGPRGRIILFPTREWLERFWSSGYWNNKIGFDKFPPTPLVWDTEKDWLFLGKWRSVCLLYQEAGLFCFVYLVLKKKVYLQQR